MLPSHATGDQAEILAFLADRRTHGLGEPVSRIDTHAAAVFLAGAQAYKVKRAVRFPFLDYSTIEKRRQACEAEVAINRPNAPDLYLGTVAITKPGGALQLNGSGEIVEWAVHMRRFDETQTLDKVIARGGLSPELIRTLSRAIARSHDAAPRRDGAAASAFLRRCIDENHLELLEHPALFPMQRVEALTARARERHAKMENLLITRGQQGYVRRCHGDLHLRNLVLLHGEPTLFDAIEFDDAIATGDVLYDLSFLIMDLWARNLKHAANEVLNRYLWQRGASHYEALAAMPLFLSLRAVIRAKVTAASVAHLTIDDGIRASAEARHYFALAEGFLHPQRPSAVAVGGLSGTGKSTLASALAPLIGQAPGALHVRSDIERKAIWGVEETLPLTPSAYGAAIDREVYARVQSRACLALEAGYSVVMDAVFRQAGERDEAEAVVEEFGARFVGLWLEAPLATLIQRVTGRTGDASDAHTWIVEGQWQAGVGTVTWNKLDASDELAGILRAALSLCASPEQRMAFGHPVRQSIVPAASLTKDRARS